MTDPIATARAARENLSQGLAALQDPNVPQELLGVAQPIAKAMSALHRIESSGALAEAAPEALAATREALASLQNHTPAHPAVDRALSAVAGSLGFVHSLAQSAARPSTPPRPSSVPRPAPSRPPAPAISNAALPVAHTVALADAQLPEVPLPAHVFNPGATALISEDIPPPPLVTTPQMPFAVVPGPGATLAIPEPPYVVPVQTAGATLAIQEPIGAGATLALQDPGPGGTLALQDPGPGGTLALAEAPPLVAGGTLPLGGTQVIADAAANAGSAPSTPKVQAPAEIPQVEVPKAAATPRGTAEASVPPKSVSIPASAPKDAIRMEAALGAHSPTNFYKGLSGNDVVDSGGIFVATYQMPEIGQRLWLKIALPGGYEFEALAVVRWTREAPLSGMDSPPGFGAQLVELTSEARQLIYRYVRNREPLFHDDF